MNKQPVKMIPGDKLHLTLLMAPHGLNFVTGQDREHLLAYARTVFEAGQANKCLHQIAEPAARFCPECGHVGDVEAGHRDCCPDGSSAFTVPAKWANELRAGFKAQLAASPQAVQPAVPKPFTSTIMLDDGGDRPYYCLMTAYLSEAEARAALSLLSAPAQPVRDAVSEADAFAQLVCPRQAMRGPSGALEFFHDLGDAMREVWLAGIKYGAAQGMTEAARSVLAERARQIAAEGWTPEKDDAYNPGVLAEAGGIYALHAFDPRRVKETPEGWPWSPEWWKPKDPRSNLVKAGALILAEIERIDRTYAAQAKEGGAA